MGFTYSYLNASIGSSLAAFLAGYIPKKMPTAEENSIAPIITVTEIAGVIFATFPINSAPTIPSVMPIRPPIMIIILLQQYIYMFILYLYIKLSINYLLLPGEFFN